MTPTTYPEIYDVFLSNINDLTFIQADTDDSLKKRYLQNSIPRFKRCKQNLSARDDANNKFNIELSDEEKLILGILMLIEYLNPQIISKQNIKQSLTNGEFSMTSQAAHLKQLIDLRKTRQDEVKKLIVDYTYNNADLSELK